MEISSFTNVFWYMYRSTVLHSYTVAYMYRWIYLKVLFSFIDLFQRNGSYSGREWAS